MVDVSTYEYKGTLRYAGKEWSVDDESSRAALLIEKDDLLKKKESKRRLGSKTGTPLTNKGKAPWRATEIPIALPSPPASEEAPGEPLPEPP
ncbi:hypothetical protein ACN28S_67635 [Cystobacter fuscus]